MVSIGLKYLHLMRKLLVVLLCLFSGASWAVCERITPDATKNERVFDPPGSFGPFDRTVTLDCLSYVGYKKSRKGEPVAIIKDETGKLYHVKRQEPMGMDRSAHIGLITPDQITIERIVQDTDGNLMAGKPIYMPRIWPKK